MQVRQLSRREFAYLSLYLLVVGAGSLEVVSLFGPEIIYNGYDSIYERLIKNCPDINQNIGRGLLSWNLVCLSDSLGNARAVPFLFSLGLIPLGFLFTQVVTKSDTAALLAAVGLAINPVYLIFNDSAAFHQFWAFFIVASMYAAYKKPILAAPLFILAILSKPIAIFFVPALFIMLYPKKIPMISLGVVTASILAYTLFGGTALIQGYVTPPDYTAFERIYWIFTKHTGLFMLPFLVFSMVWYRDRVSLALLSVVFCYLLAAMFTSAEFFPYHTIPIIMMINTILASNLVKIKKAQTISTKEIKV